MPKVLEFLKKDLIYSIILLVIIVSLFINIKDDNLENDKSNGNNILSEPSGQIILVFILVFLYETYSSLIDKKKIHYYELTIFFVLFVGSFLLVSGNIKDKNILYYIDNFNDFAFDSLIGKIALIIFCIFIGLSSFNPLNVFLALGLIIYTSYKLITHKKNDEKPKQN